MSKKKTFADNFENQDLPKELASLWTFQNEQSGFEEYAEGFGLYYDDKGLLKTWSQDAAFLNAFIPFAQASGGGSVYALWCTAADLRSVPVVIFGDEGGAHLVAENLLAFLQLLTFGPEPMVGWDEVTYYRSDDFEERADAAAYRTWAQEVWGIQSVDDADPIVAAAQKKHGQAFAAFMKKYSKE